MSTLGLSISEQEQPASQTAARTFTGPRRRVRSPGWPLVVLLGGFPVFWALGLPNLAAPIMAVPMFVHLRRMRPVKVPRGFILWALFLVWSVGAVAVIGVNPPDTVPDSVPGRLLAYGFRELSYFAVTIVMLYIGNLSEAEFPQRRLLRLLGWFFIWTVAGGVVGLLWPYFEFTSPFELLLPGSIRNNLYVQHLVHPASAQVQELLGGTIPRPAAPFGYTNTWGFHITVLGVWFAASWVVGQKLGSRLVGLSVLAVGAIVLVYSLNRAAWAGCLFLLVYFVVRMALRGNLLPLAFVLVALIAAVPLVASTPLRGVVDARLSAGKSDSIRAFTTQRALELSVKSPVVGYGSTRAAQGSASSIAVGKSRDCPQCGNISIGINGFSFMLLMSTGWVGTFLFFGFGAVQVWRVRGVNSPTVVSGIAVMLLTGAYGFAYDISTWMLVPMVTLGILWREARRREATAG